MTCRWHAATQRPRAATWGEHGSLPEGIDLERKVGRDGPVFPLIPRMNEARPFSQEPPLRIARQGCPFLLQQLWERLCSGPICICFPCPGSPHSHSSPGLLLSNHFSYGIAQQFLLPPCAALPLSDPKPSLSPSSLPSSQADKNTKRSFTALSCFLPKGRE